MRPQGRSLQTESFEVGPLGKFVWCFTYAHREGKKISFLSLSWLVPCKGQIKKEKKNEQVISIHTMLMQGAPRKEQFRGL